MMCLYLLCFILKLTSGQFFRTAAPVINCQGTDNGLSKPADQNQHYESLRKRYTNCTHVNGNLEVTWLQSNNKFDLSFLEDIREITGYLLISHVDVPKIPLTALEQIHGKILFKHDIFNDEFGIFISKNDISSLEMSSLKSLTNGSVGIYDNKNLCHVQTINWREIIFGEESHYINDFQATSWEEHCPKCDASCTEGCWGVGQENCQKFRSRWIKSMAYAFRNAGQTIYSWSDYFRIKPVNQTQAHWQNPCTASQKIYCCHSNCTEACTGPKPSDCVPCKYFDKNGKCIRECIGSLSPKALNPIVPSNINSFKGCTTIHGSLDIIIYTNYSLGYSNGSWTSVEFIHPNQLEVFNTVKEITGSLSIQGSDAIPQLHVDSNFKNLSHFKNLEIIRAETPSKFGLGLFIARTSLNSAKLPSLKEISNGTVIIAGNENLCEESFEYWKKVIKSPTENPIITNNCCPISLDEFNHNSQHDI